MERLNVTINLTPEYGVETIEVPADYHSNVMSLLKYVISKHNYQLYEHLFMHNTPKLYTWAFNFPKSSQFMPGGTVELYNMRLSLRMGFADPELAREFHDAFVLNSNPDKKLFGQYFNITSVHQFAVGYNVIDSARLKTVSNIACEVKDEEDKALFIKPSDPEYKLELENLLRTKAEMLGMDVYNSQISIDVSGLHTVYNSIYGAKLPVARGEVTLSGDDDLIEIAMAGGIGSITGSGFGMLKQV